MEHSMRGMEFGTVSFQRCQMAESMQLDAQKAVIRRKEKSPAWRSRCEEMMPVIPEQAMEFLSRTWNPSCSPDIFQILSPTCLRASAEDHHERDEIKEDEDRDKELDAVRLMDGGKSQLFNQNQAWRVGKPSSKQRTHNRVNQPFWMNFGHMRAMLRDYFLDTVSFTGSRRRRRRDSLRLHSAQAQAAVSVAQLAAAIAGVVSAEPRRSHGVDGDGVELARVLASAATLVATVCAEAAESAGAHRPRVTSAVNTGLESRSPAEILTLTAAAATCLRGAAALKLRAADVRGVGTAAASGHGICNPTAASIDASISKGTALRVCLPCGRVRVRTVAVFPRRGAGGSVALKLGKKRLRGAFATYEDHEVLAVSPGGEGVVDGKRCFVVALSTPVGTVQLLLKDQTHCEVWKDAIQGMLSDAKLKHC